MLSTTQRPDRKGQTRLRDLSVPVLIPLWLALAALMARAAFYFGSRHQLGVDAHAYWLTGNHAQLYGPPPNAHDAFLYSPAFAQLVWPLTQLPWGVFIAVWIVGETAAFAWLLKPLGLAWGVPALLLCVFEIEQGNITGFLALALVLGMRRPGAWALPLLTKVLVCIGPIWFVARGEWRALRTFAVTTALIVGVSVAISPHLWTDWIGFLFDHRGSDPSAVLRFVAAAACVVVAARRNKPWVLAPAMILASPLLTGIGEYLSLLAAIPRLRAYERAQAEPSA
jgi:hypothetical protein